MAASCLKHMNSEFSEFMYGVKFLAGIQLEEVYLLEALDHRLIGIRVSFCAILPASCSFLDIRLFSCIR